MQTSCTIGGGDLVPTGYKVVLGFLCHFLGEAFFFLTQYKGIWECQFGLGMLSSGCREAFETEVKRVVNSLFVPC